MRSMTGLAVLTLLLCLLHPAPASADLVYMKNGEIVPGTVVEEIPDQLVKVVLANGYTRVLTYANVDHVVRGAVDDPALRNTGYRPTREYPKALVGLVAGPSMSYYYVRGRDDNKAIRNGTLGFTAGGMLDLSLISLVSIRPGVVFTMRDKADYAYVPVDLLLKFPYVPGVSMYVLAGCRTGFLLAARNGADAGELNHTDIGLDLGAGTEIPGMNGKLVPFLEFGYFFGFSDVNKSASQDLTNRGPEVTIGVKYRL